MTYPRQRLFFQPVGDRCMCVPANQPFDDVNLAICAVSAVTRTLTPPVSHTVKWGGVGIWLMHPAARTYDHILCSVSDGRLYEVIFAYDKLYYSHLTEPCYSRGCQSHVGWQSATGDWTKDQQFSYRRTAPNELTVKNVGDSQAMVAFAAGGSAFTLPQWMGLTTSTTASFDGFTNCPHNVMVEDRRRIIRTLTRIDDMLIVDDTRTPMRCEWSVSWGDLAPPYAPDPANVRTPKVRIGEFEMEVRDGGLWFNTVAKAAGTTRAMQLVKGYDVTAATALSIGATPVSYAVDANAGINEYYLVDSTSAYRIIVAELPKIQQTDLPGVLLWVQHVI